MKGRQFGHVRILSLLGKGGMGDVWLAYHEGLDKKVAVKTLHPGLADDPECAERFIREAHLAAKLDHPNVVQIYDAAAEGGVLYMVMQRVEGTDLSKMLTERGSMSVDDSLRIVADVARALEAAHELNILHRDIKPSNILISRKGHVLVSDFGLARDQTTESSLTLTGSVVGTPHYMSPEQAQSKPVDGRSDMYSLGAMFYAMLAGRPPHIASTPVGVLLKHAKEDEFPPPLNTLNSEVTPPVIALIEKMMAKKVGDRFADMKEVVEAVEALRQNASTTTLEAPRVKPERRLPPWAMAAAGVLAVTLVVALVFAVTGYGETDPTPPTPARTADEILKAHENGSMTFSEALAALRPSASSLELDQLHRTCIARRTERFLSLVRDGNFKEASTLAVDQPSEADLKRGLRDLMLLPKIGKIQSFSIQKDGITFDLNQRVGECPYEVKVRGTGDPMPLEFTAPLSYIDFNWYLHIVDAGPPPEGDGPLQAFMDGRVLFSRAYEDILAIEDGGLRAEQLEHLHRFALTDMSRMMVEALQAHEFGKIRNHIYVPDGERMPLGRIGRAMKVLTTQLDDKDVLEVRVMEEDVRLAGDEATVKVSVIHLTKDGKWRMPISLRWILSGKQWRLRLPER